MEVQKAFASGNRLAIPGMITDPAGEAGTISRYHDVERALYWQAHDLPAAVFVAEQGIAYCLIRAITVAGNNPNLSRRLRGAAGRIAFNLASSTWPGWNEPGIEVTPEQRELGREGARFALSVSEELDAGAGPLANGHWMVGAHELAAGEFEEAITSFERAALYGRAAGDRGTELVSEGFAAITRIAANMDAGDARERLGEIRATIERELGNPSFWTSQFDTATQVFIEAPD